MKKINNKKQSIIQGVLALVIILLLNYISTFVFFRWDLTSEKRYTLSNVTKGILKDTKDIFYIKVYLEGDIPIGFARMNKSIKELLDEFRVYAGENIQYEFINPSAEEDEEIRNRVYNDLYDKGLNPTNVQSQDKEGGSVEKIIFPGVMIHYNNIEFPLNLLKNNPGLPAEINLNNSIQSLEYEFVKAIYNLQDELIKKVAFIEGHGELNEFETGDIMKELSNYYQVDIGQINGQMGILDGYQAIIIARPLAKFSEPDKLVIDQYIMNGGKVLWCLDAVNVNMDSLILGKTIAFMNNLNLDDQLFRYGVRINPTIVKDLQCALIPMNTALKGNDPNFVPVQWVYYPLIYPREDHTVTKSLNMIRMEFPSSVDTVGSDPKVKKTLLLTSSQYSRVMNIPALISLEEFKVQPQTALYNNSFQSLGVLLEGEFKSVFANRMVDNIIPGSRKNLKKNSKMTKMIVIADGDIIRNDIRETPQGILVTPLGYDRYSKQTFGNKEFVSNAVNYLTDEVGLMNLRGREFKLRLLDKTKLKGKKSKWQMINTILPVLLIVVFGLTYNYSRKRKYAKTVSILK